MNKGLIFAIDLLDKREFCGIEQTENPTWLHFDYSNPQTKLWFLEESNLPIEIVRAFLDTHSTNRFISSEKGFFFVFRALNLNEGEDKEDMINLHIWVENNRIITMRSLRVKGIEEIKNKMLKQKKNLSTKKVFLDILELLTENTANYVFELYENIDAIDEVLIENFVKGLRHRISDLRKKIIELRRFLLPQKILLESLYKENIFSNGERNHLKAILEHNSKIVEDLNSLKDRANICQEEFNGKISDQMTKTMYTLTILSTIFLPLNFIASMLGVNVSGIPGANYPHAFLLVCIIVFLVALLEYFWFKKNRYL